MVGMVADMKDRREEFENEQGYVLLAVIFLMVILLISLAIAAPKMATHPATKNLASATRLNLVVCIAVSFEPVYRHGPRGLTILPSIRRFRRGSEEAIAKFGSGIASHCAEPVTGPATSGRTVASCGYLPPAIRGKRIERLTFYC